MLIFYRKSEETNKGNLSHEIVRTSRFIFKLIFPYLLYILHSILRKFFPPQIICSGNSIRVINIADKDNTSLSLFTNLSFSLARAYYCTHTLCTYLIPNMSVMISIIFYDNHVVPTLNYGNIMPDLVLLYITKKYPSKSNIHYDSLCQIISLLQVKICSKILPADKKKILRDFKILL